MVRVSQDADRRSNWAPEAGWLQDPDGRWLQDPSGRSGSPRRKSLSSCLSLQSAPVATVEVALPPPALDQQPDPAAVPAPCPPAPGWKYLVGLCAASIVICYADRSNISTAILPMSIEFGWDKAFQGLVLSSFFGGYAATQMAGGALADRYGGKLVLASGVMLWSFFTFLTPAAAAAGAVPLLAARVALGLGEGVAFPAIHSLIACNVPRAYQTTAVGVVTAASYVGTAVAFGVAPLIIAGADWQTVYHLCAAMAVLWLPLWLMVHPRRPTPLKLRQPGLGGVPALLAALPGFRDGAGGGGGASSGGDAFPLPASTLGLSLPHGSASTSNNGTSTGSGGVDSGAPAIGLWPLLKRKEVWAICAAQYGQSWGMYGLLTWLPTYFHDVYFVEVGQLGSYTLLPYIVQGTVGLATGLLADKLITSGCSVRRVRVGLQTVGMLGTAACLLLAVTAADGSPARASAIITVALGLSALTLGGVSASHLDIAPRHAGAVYGAGNTAATIAGLLSVPTTGLILQATGSWPLVFTIISLHYCVGAALYATWAGDSPLPEDGGPVCDRTELGVTGPPPAAGGPVAAAAAAQGLRSDGGGGVGGGGGATAIRGVLPQGAAARVEGEPRRAGTVGDWRKGGDGV